MHLVRLRNHVHMLVLYTRLLLWMLLWGRDLREDGGLRGHCGIDDGWWNWFLEDVC